MEYLQNCKVFVPKIWVITAKGRKWEQLVWGYEVKSTQGGRRRKSNQDLSSGEKRKDLGVFGQEKDTAPQPVTFWVFPSDPSFCPCGAWPVFH